MSKVTENVPILMMMTGDDLMMMMMKGMVMMVLTGSIDLIRIR